MMLLREVMRRGISRYHVRGHDGRLHAPDTRPHSTSPPSQRVSSDKSAISEILPTALTRIPAHSYFPRHPSRQLCTRALLPCSSRTKNRRVEELALSSSIDHGGVLTVIHPVGSCLPSPPFSFDSCITRLSSCSKDEVFSHCAAGGTQFSLRPTSRGGSQRPQDRRPSPAR